MDDIKPVSNKVRILVHLIAVALLFFQLSIYNLPFYLIALAFDFVIGTINAVNFMDGINGMTALFSFSVMFGLFVVNNKMNPWYKQRDMPEGPKESFSEWYEKNRQNKK